MRSYLVDEHQFHDNLIHGVVFATDVGDFSSDIHFDIDHITEWVHCSPKEGEALFLVNKALLKFHNVSDLNMNIVWGDTQYSKYSGCRSGLHIIDIKKEIVRSSLSNTKEEYFKWKIVTHNRESTIEFGASSLSLELIGEPKQVNRQYLLNEERK